MSDGILGVVLAGGLATRMGGSDKGLLRLGQQTILDEVLERLHPQVDDVVLNVNGDVERFGSFGLPCIADSLTGYLGPLAGVLAALEYAREHQFQWVASVAADTPFFPTDFVARAMGKALESQAPVVLASSFDDEKSKWMRHPTFGLWNVSLENNLRDALQSGIRKIVIWTDSVRGAEVQFARASGSRDPFFNVNTREDLVVAQQEEQR
ncbi:molybdenum cofactor guanylyltransferase MobA [Litorivicinus sp.]|nr:molybdenum cofactor guanylyltransferase MobA [Litorivicinus sp.]